MLITLVLSVILLVAAVAVLFNELNRAEATSDDLQRQLDEAHALAAEYATDRDLYKRQRNIVRANFLRRYAAEQAPKFSPKEKPLKRR